MTFNDTLKELVEGLPGGMAATVMGADGLAIGQFTLGGARYDVETVGIEYGKVLEEIKHASTLLNLGEVKEVIVSTPEANLILKMLTPEYYMAFLVDGKANVGKARYLLRKAADKARKELLA